MQQIVKTPYLIILLIGFMAAINSSSVKAVDQKDVSINAYADAEHTPVNDLWERIRNGFALSSGFDSQKIRNNERSYTKNPKYIYKIFLRGKRYLHYIVEEVERRNMPTEIALLPIVESAFKPNAKSSSNAVGLWQFMPTTGRSLGLKQNEWHDDRKDVLAATDAALDYLQNLYMMFGDWKLVIAAYNWGEGAVRRSLVNNRKAGLSTKFRDLTLPDETRNHVYRLLAVKNIIANPTDFGIKLAAIPNQPYFDKIQIHQQLEISLAAEMANITVEDFNALNPAYNQSIIKVIDAPRIILLPMDKTQLFLSNFEDYFKPLVLSQKRQEKEVPSTQEMSLQQNMGMAQLWSVNATNEANIDIQESAIQASHLRSNLPSYVTTVNSKPVANKQLKRDLVYIVKEGDTLDELAKRYGITVKLLKLWNNNDENLTVGQELILMRFRSYDPQKIGDAYLKIGYVTIKC